jgi:hypothetical protein
MGGVTMNMENYIKKTVKERLKENPFYVRDLLRHGCKSAVEPEMICCYDTTKFYKKYKKEINLLLRELIFSTGLPIEQLLKDWDTDDPLASDTWNQNLLAWVAWEETVYRLYGEKYGF